MAHFSSELTKANIEAVTVAGAMANQDSRGMAMQKFSRDFNGKSPPLILVDSSFADSLTG